MKTTKPKSIGARLALAATPIRDWPPECIMREAMRAAKLWSAHPAFNNGGPLDDVDARAQEIVARVLDYLKKKPHDDEIDQVTFFYQIVGYCKPGIIQSCYHIQTVSSDADAGSGEEDDDWVEYTNQEMSDPRASDDRKAWENLMRKIGIKERDAALFQTPTRDWVEATGLSERQHREMKTKRKLQLINIIKNKNLADDLVRLMPSLKNVFLAREPG